jgi:hypothetical protein
MLISSQCIRMCFISINKSLYKDKMLRLQNTLLKKDCLLLLNIINGITECHGICHTR